MLSRDKVVLQLSVGVKIMPKVFGGWRKLKADDGRFWVRIWLVSELSFTSTYFDRILDLLADLLEVTQRTLSSSNYKSSVEGSSKRGISSQEKMINRRSERLEL